MSIVSIIKFIYIYNFKTTEPDNYKVKWMRVETLYKIGEFGKSLVHAYPGYQCHQCRYPFEDAIYRANDTIENCIGCNTLENVMVEMLLWINKLQEQQFNLIAKLSDDGDEFEGKKILKENILIFQIKKKKKINK